ncbi:MAG: DUF5395 family protein [Gammaproteobacteria bacterium]|nr:DUF5395 family protein [Gammaproteobacteria bacterium]
MSSPGLAPVELTLHHEAGRWRAVGDGIDVAHADLAGLDRLIGEAVRRRNDPPRRVHVRFDVDRLPAWMRQYQAHYFNYVLTLNDGADA